MVVRSRLGALFLLVAVLAFATSGASPVRASPRGDASQATLTVLEDSVTVVEGGSGSSRAGVSGDTLTTGDRLITGAPGHALLTFFDGAEQEISPGSEVLLQAVGQTESGGTLIQLAQAAGQTSSRLGQLADDASYQVQTPNMTILVRGTKFQVGVVRDPQTNTVARERLDVDEGNVQVRVGQQVRQLRSGQSLEVVPQGGGLTDVSPVPSLGNAQPPSGGGNTSLTLTSDEGSAVCSTEFPNRSCPGTLGRASGTLAGRAIDGSFDGFLLLDTTESGAATVDPSLGGIYVNVDDGQLRYSIRFLVPSADLSRTADSPITYSGSGTWQAVNNHGTFNGVEICDAAGTGTITISTLQADSTSFSNAWRLELNGDVTLTPC